MNILGIHYGHNATVVLAQDGKVVFSLSEERLNRLKNSNGFPVLALQEVYNHFAKPEQIDLAVLFQKDVAGYLEQKRVGFKSVRNFGITNINAGRRYSFLRHASSKLPGYFLLRGLLGQGRHKMAELLDRSSGESLKYYAKVLQLPPEKIVSLDHHFSHAYSSAFNLDPQRQTLIFTMDGEGDGVSSSVSLYQDYRLKTLSLNPVSVSIGYFFTEITKLLGMIPNEHEFKVMGLAPYAKQEKSRQLYEKLQGLLWLDGELKFQSLLPMPRLEYYLLEQLYGQRFDTIAAFAQMFLEEKVLQWVRAWIAKTGIRHLALGGGVFMSVKLNQKILELPEVESLFVMPSAADESTAIGAAAYGTIVAHQRQGTQCVLKPVSDLYLGKAYPEFDLEKYLRDFGLADKYQVQKFGGDFEIEKAVAKLLSENQVVARMKGRSEWGARALGNRSILANPANRDSVRVINEMIKNRDFWMPFASSVLEEDQERYFINPKRMPSPYMAITFQTTALAQKHLLAAIHPYDFTCRPQVVYRSWNPAYHALISAFRGITGIGGVLNTSFNLHGEPNVETPADALRTFELSGLRHLALENFLISKK